MKRFDLQKNGNINYADLYIENQQKNREERSKELKEKAKKF